MPLNLPRSAQIELRDKANHAIWEGAYSTGLGILPSGEVAWLKNLVEQGIPRIEDEWQKLFAQQYDIHLSGFVCHGRPYVKFSGNAKACELGGFLLVHNHQPNASPPERRAVVVQAKVFYDAMGVTSKNQLQLDLYSDWPEFEYTDWPGGLGKLEQALRANGLFAGSSTPYIRDISLPIASGSTRLDSNTIDSSGRYGMVEVDYMKSLHSNYRRSPWRLCSPHAPPNVYQSTRGFKLGTYLARLIRGDAGRNVPKIGWPVDLNSACHWSLMVEELMTLHSAPALAAGGSSISSSLAQSLGAAANPWHDKSAHKASDPADGGHQYTPKRGAEGPREGGFAVIVVNTIGGPEEIETSTRPR